MPGFDFGPYTGAETYQIWTEHQRGAWNHTAAIIGYIKAANSASTKKVNIEELNPMESAGDSQRIPLNSKAGFQRLQSVADQWHRH